MRCGLVSHSGKCLLQDGTAFPKTTQAHHDSVCSFYMDGCHDIANLENVQEREREREREKGINLQEVKQTQTTCQNLSVSTTNSL
jgi:hypothetical protein